MPTDHESNPPRPRPISRPWDAAPPSRRGRHTAYLFRRAREVSDGAAGARAVDLGAILAEDDLHVCELDGAAGQFTAALWRHPDGPGGAIFLAAGQPRARRRFSIAHELGHYHIPRHAQLQRNFACTAEAMSTGIVPTPLNVRDWRERAAFRAAGYAGMGYPAVWPGERDVARELLRQEMEWEANDFAAELLMPRRLFDHDTRRHDVSMATVLRTAEAYDVSATAVAWRLVRVTDEAVALAVVADGVLQWAVRSDACPPLACTAGGRPDASSAAAAVSRGEAHRVVPERVPPRAWLAEPDRCRGPLLESTVRVRNASGVSGRRVLALLWLPEHREGPHPDPAAEFTI